jgi:hypothetical protein
MADASTMRLLNLVRFTYITLAGTVKKSGKAGKKRP